MTSTLSLRLLLARLYFLPGAHLSGSSSEDSESEAEEPDDVDLELADDVELDRLEVLLEVEEEDIALTLRLLVLDLRITEK